jgi:hypothetical protein
LYGFSGIQAGVIFQPAVKHNGVYHFVDIVSCRVKCHNIFLWNQMIVKPKEINREYNHSPDDQDSRSAAAANLQKVTVHSHEN